MAKKYNKVSKEEVLELFSSKKIVNRKHICDKYNCSVYSVRRLLEELQDDKLIRLTNHGYTKI